MRLPSGITGLAGLLSLTSRQFEADSHAYVDTETGLKFAAYNSDRGIAFRVALPGKIEAGKDFDIILQVAAPIEIGWVGFAWGGSMTYNPLAIMWPNGTSNAVLASRIAYGYYTPPAYEQAKYTVLKTGTHINSTHFQVTTLCKGCSRWGDEEIGFTEIDATAEETTFGFAYGNHAVDNPASADSTFAIHDSIGHPIYKLAVATNDDFDAKVAAL